MSDRQPEKFLPTPAVAAATTAVRITGGDPSTRQPINTADVLAQTAANDVGLVVVLVKDFDQAVLNWIGAAGFPLTTIKDSAGWTLYWVPGRACVQGPVKFHESLLKAVTAVDHAEKQLREVAAALPPFESVAAGDVEFAYRISVAHRSRWKRFERTIQDLYRLRLKLAKFDPAGGGGGTGGAGPGRTARRAVGRLSTRLRLDDRVEVLSDRLEALEDLYEGAVDRIVDHRWYVIGIAIEVLIVLLLGAETVLLIARSGK